MMNTLKDKKRTIKFFTIVYLLVLLLIVIKEKFFYSGSKYSPGKVLDWSGIIDNLPWYLGISFFSAVLFTYIYVHKSIKKK